MTTVLGIELPPAHWPRDFKTFLSTSREWNIITYHYNNDSIVEDQLKLYRDAVLWIKENVSDYKNNAYWREGAGTIYIRLRCGQAATFFTLKFGQSQ